MELEIETERERERASERDRKMNTKRPHTILTTESSEREKQRLIPAFINNSLLTRPIRSAALTVVTWTGGRIVS